MNPIINAILDIATLVAALWVLDRLMVLSGGRGIFSIEKELEKRRRDRENDYQYLFERLCRKAEKKPFEMFKIACKEQGFNWSDKVIETHLNRWIKFGCQDKDLPNYVEAFIDKGKEYILK